MSAQFIAATQTLFEQGLADPRGCEYREIEVLVGGFIPPWTDELIKTHGWVLPRASTQDQQFGICWNGLIYPLAGVGKLMNLGMDAAAATNGDVMVPLGPTGVFWVPYFENGVVGHPWEGRSVSYDSPLPVKACLLLRLGEPKLAERIWNRWASGPSMWALPELHVPPERAQVIEANKKVPYLTLANSWTLSLFDRATAAHLRGDDALALASSEMLARVWPSVEAAAAKLGLARATAARHSSSDRYFLLNDVARRELLADQRRRAQQRLQKSGPLRRDGEYVDPGKFAAALRQRLAQCTTSAQRAALLIGQFEEEQGGACDLHPIPRLLEQEGEAAVEPLLACLETDNRLTRQASRYIAYPVAVERLAEPLLEKILLMPFSMFSADAEKLRDEGLSLRACAPSIRKHWTRYQHVPMAERWYHILNDDQAGLEQWRVAAAAIVQRASIPLTLDTIANGWDVSGESRMYWDRHPKIASDGKMHGEVLRTKSNPSIADLIAKRVEGLNRPYQDFVIEHERLMARQMRHQRQKNQLKSQLEKVDKQLNELPEGTAKDWFTPEKRKILEDRDARLTNQRDDLWSELDTLQSQDEELNKRQEDLEHRWTDWRGSHPDGYDLVLNLVRWNPRAAIPLLRRLTRIYKDTEDPRKRVRLFVARANAGDAEALQEYALWIREVFARHDETPQEFAPGSALERLAHSWEPKAQAIVELLEPIWRYPEAPAIAEVIQWLLNGKESPCNLLIHPGENEGPNEPPWHLLRGPFLMSAAFRKQVLRLLEDKSQVGECFVPIASDPRKTGELKDGQSPLPDYAEVLRRVFAAYRRCDLYAYQLSGLEGAPKCELFWPEKERDQAVTACASFLRQYGHRFRLYQDDPLLKLDHRAVFCLAFPRLAHPATREEVRRGDAIFSLAGLGPARVAQVPNLPYRVTWPALREYPYATQVQDSNGHLKKSVGYEQEGTVWQAEELLVGGRWQRYYGFVGPHGLARVPAEEIVFQPEEIASDEEWAAQQSEEEWIKLEGHLQIGLKAAVNCEERSLVDRGDDRFCPSMRFYRTGQPMVFKVRVCNRSGLDRPFPFLFEEASGRRPTGSIPMSLQLDFCPAEPPVQRNSWGLALYSVAGISWNRVPRRSQERLKVDPGSGFVTPGDYGDCLDLDLNRLFDVSRPGTYRLSLKLATGNKGVWQENVIVFAVTDEPPYLPNRPDHQVRGGVGSDPGSPPQPLRR